MSYTWREWVKQASSKQLGITESERIEMEKKIHLFCAIGDKKIKDQVGENAKIDQVFDNMPEEQKEDFSKEVIIDGLILLGLRKKKIEDEELEKIAETQGQQMIRNH